LVHPDRVDQLTDRTLAVTDRVEDPPPRRFGDHLEDCERCGHRSNIPTRVYTCKRILG
jgi:hypothetical protein